MSVVANHVSAGRAVGAHRPHRPTWLLSVLVDGALAVGAYPASYFLRFQGEALATFLPRSWSSLPVVVVGQLAALFVAGAYARRPRIDWLVRVVAGVAAGTAAASVLLNVTRGFEGVSRTAFVADAMLLTVATLGWRGVWILRSRAWARAGAPVASTDLVDRAACGGHDEGHP